MVQTTMVLILKNAISDKVFSNRHTLSETQNAPQSIVVCTDCQFEHSTVPQTKSDRLYLKN